ncbi:hypothetical protein VNO80_22785 [Phaseolus coccineus]
MHALKEYYNFNASTLILVWVRIDSSTVLLALWFVHVISFIMSGVWVFKNGVVRLVENPGGEAVEGSRGGRRKMLVHLASNEVITSYSVLERKLYSLGWERYYDDPDLLQFHKRSTVHLISLPRDFNKFKSMHMYDIVVKNKNAFEVRDM